MKNEYKMWFIVVLALLFMTCVFTYMNLVYTARITRDIEKVNNELLGGK